MIMKRFLYLFLALSISLVSCSKNEFDISRCYPEITMYGINWGIDLYDNMSYENAWYRVDGDWYLGQNNYIWNRSMITGFSVL